MCSDGKAVHKKVCCTRRRPRCLRRCPVSSLLSPSKYVYWFLFKSSSSIQIFNFSAVLTLLVALWPVCIILSFKPLEGLQLKDIFQISDWTLPEALRTKFVLPNIIRYDSNIVTQFDPLCLSLNKHFFKVSRFLNSHKPKTGLNFTGHNS